LSHDSMGGSRALDSGEPQGRISMVIPVPHLVVHPQDTAQFPIGMAETAICNPIYAGIPPYPPLVSDEEWIAAARRVIEQEGPERFLTNMLYLLRVAMLYVMDTDKKTGDPEYHTTH
jgi:hypothetical protein